MNPRGSWSAIRPRYHRPWDIIWQIYEIKYTFRSFPTHFQRGHIAASCSPFNLPQTLWYALLCASVQHRRAWLRRCWIQPRSAGAFCSSLFCVAHWSATHTPMHGSIEAEMHALLGRSSRHVLQLPIAFSLELFRTSLSEQFSAGPKRASHTNRDLTVRKNSKFC